MWCGLSSEELLLELYTIGTLQVLNRKRRGWHGDVTVKLAYECEFCAKHDVRATLNVTLRSK